MSKKRILFSKRMLYNNVYMSGELRMRFISTLNALGVEVQLTDIAQGESKKNGVLLYETAFDILLEKGIYVGTRHEFGRLHRYDFANNTKPLYYAVLKQFDGISQTWGVNQAKIDKSYSTKGEAYEAGIMGALYILKKQL